MIETAEQTKPAEHTLWKVLEESDKLRAERDELLEALKFYADKMQWRHMPAHRGAKQTPILYDNGDKARAAIKKIDAAK